MADTNTMSNDEIIESFESLFGASAEDEEAQEAAANAEDEDTDETVDEGEENNDGEDEDTDEDGSDEDSEGEDSDDDSSEEDSSKAKAKQTTGSKQNFAFAQMRQRNKELENSLKGLGTLIGLENASVPEIEQKLKDVLLEKQSKESGVPKEILERLDRAEGLIAENDRIKQENNVKNAFSALIEKYGLDAEQVQDFTKYLTENGLNPMSDKTVDIEAQYLKLHFKDLMDNAVQAALDKESARKNKVDTHSTEGVPSGKNEDGEEHRITSVAEFDKFLDGVDIG